MSSIDPKTRESKFTHDDIAELEGLGMSYWEQIHRELDDDLTFSYATGLDQWDPMALQARGGRPAETYNIINGFVRPVVSLAKQNPPAINVFPVADGASKTNARLLSGVIRAIEYSCGAQREYCSALETAVRGGLGILRIIPRLSEINDQDVDFVISNEVDPTSVIIDPSARKADFSDANWVIVKSSIAERQYRREYPDGHATGLNGIVDISELWIKERVKTKTLDASGREVTRKTVHIIQYIYDDHEILETITTYPGKYLPFAVVTGARYMVDKVAHYQSMTRELRGLQKEINFFKSEEIATIACAPKATFYGDSDVFETPEEQQAWEESATNPRVYLGHKPGASVNQFRMPEIPNAYIEASKDNVDFARIVTGIYPDPTTQNGLSPISGKAIKQQQAGQAIATYGYVDSLNYAVKHVGEVLLDLLPYYWNDDQIRLSMGIDGRYDSVSMGPNNIEGAQNFDLAYGRYNVSISTGPSYSSQKDALIEMIMDSIKTNPQAMSIALPWIINQINLPGSEELADMFSLTLPPEIQQFLQQQKQGSANPEEQLKAALMQLQKMAQDSQQKKQMIDQLTAALQNETAQLKSKEQEIQAKKDIEEQKSQSAMILEAVKHQHDMEIAELKARTDALSKSIEIYRADRDIKNQTATDLAMKQLDHVNDIDSMHHKAAASIITAQLNPKP